ncbi:Mgm101p-domain-containing protein [Trichocladium antarcticum]|uniref:Mitochondrial genome maintenance protein MGM101 n=1 Tax=Trichocladium antarcticum TaxID=1450529 RepID=A0AAN6UIL8_9PEZI|nr:Mgm101p-domain-containing protein [Trichocladium antarcticum]
MGSTNSKEDDRPKAEEQHAPAVDPDDEPDEWDKRIFSTGCADENAKMTDCYYDKKDWRACKQEASKLPPVPARKVLEPGLEHQRYHQHSPPPSPPANPENMRSRALHACRPLRGSSPSIQCLRDPSSRPALLLLHAQAASTFTKKPASKPTKTPTYTRARQTPTPAAPATSSTPTPPTHPVLDPQAAVPPPATVADVDPALAAQIPTSNSASSAPSPAFTGALSGSASASASTNSNNNNNNSNSNSESTIDWSSSFHGLSTTPFSPETAAVLMKALDPLDIEIKPDGIIYLPEIKYRRILNTAFGPGGWGLAPRGELVVGEKVVTREFALVVHGRFIAQARGECQYFSEETIPTAGEGCKSNALLRCCKDLGIASELWDPRFIRAFKKAHCQEMWVEHVVSKKRRQFWFRKDTEPAYPYQAVKPGSRP